MKHIFAQEQSGLSKSHLFGRIPLLFALAAGLLLLKADAGGADENAEKKTLVLPRSARAAAYILGRLGNKELTEAPRSEFVYVALLQRKGLDKKFRLEALDELAKVHGTDRVTELIGALTELDGKGADSDPVLRDLGTILLQYKPADLLTKRELLEKLAGEGQLPITRQIAQAALVTAEGTADKRWAQSQSEPAKLSDLILSIPLLRDASLRAALYPKVEPLLHKTDDAEIRRAAITAIPSIPGHDLETFGTLAALVKSGDDRAVAVAALQRLPRKTWPKEQAEDLVHNLITYLTKVPVDQRTEPEVISAFQFATDLASLLPPEKSKALGKELRAVGVSVFLVRTINEQMLFDKTLIVVEAGKPVEIILMNEDAMPHNLAVVSPGALEEIGQIAERMPSEPDSQGRFYIPDSPKVLFATRLVDAGQSAKLSFNAPDQPGDYQYVCTFPGHWRRMVGTLAVVKDVDAYLESHANQPEPTITEWKIDDLRSDLAKVGPGRNLEVGKDFFTKLGCAQCHKLGTEGTAYGPDLTDVFKRYKDDRAEVLRQILEPSLVIAERFRNIQFELKNGDAVLGMVMQEDADKVTIQTGPSDALVQTLKKSDIKERLPQPSSLMPLGLLNALSKEQILDLLSYIEAGGKIPPHEHNH